MGKEVKKIYKSTTGIQYGFVVPIKRVGKILNVSVALASDLTLEVLYPDVQEAIEKTKYFKNGSIKVEREMELTEADVLKLDKAKQSEEEKLAAIKEADALEKIDKNAEETKEDKPEGTEKKVAKKEETTKTAKVEKKVEDPKKEDVKEDKPEGTEKVHAGITSPLDARDILLGEPYNVHPSAVQKNPEVILKKATELGVSFPDVKWDAQ